MNNMTITIFHRTIANTVSQMVVRRNCTMAADANSSSLSFEIRTQITPV